VADPALVWQTLCLYGECDGRSVDLWIGGRFPAIRAPQRFYLLVADVTIGQVECSSGRQGVQTHRGQERGAPRVFSEFVLTKNRILTRSYLYVGLLLGLPLAEFLQKCKCCSVDHGRMVKMCPTIYVYI